jgi:hypothetical protein
MDTSTSSHDKKEIIVLIISKNFKRVLHLILKEFDRQTPKMSHLEIPRFEKSLEQCLEIVLPGVLFMKDIKKYTKYI